MNAELTVLPAGARRAVLAILAVVLTVLPSRAQAPRPEKDDGLDVFFRASDVATIAEQEVAHYPDAEPGDSERLPRSFPGAPPQVPHSLEGLLPIRGEENACLDCHLPDEAEDAEAPAIPESHFQRPRLAGTPDSPAVVSETGMRVVVEEYEPSETLNGSQYNCVQCHVPQADNTTEPASTFIGGASEDD